VSALGRPGRSTGKAAAGTARTIEVSVGMVLLFIALYIVREIGQILSGQQVVSGASPMVVVIFLGVAGIAIAAYGFHVIRKGL
jgi:hypothetical protein